MEKSEQQIKNEALLSEIHPIAIEIAKTYILTNVAAGLGEDYTEFGTSSFTKVFMETCVEINKTLLSQNWFDNTMGKKIDEDIKKLEKKW